MGANNCKPCKRKKKISSGGSILDRVISQSSNQDQCLLYKLANYKKGGELIDAYNVGGLLEVEKLMREQFGQLLYQEGKGQIINRSEYLRWKFRDHEQVVLPIEASLSRYDPLGKWTDHEACWQMQYRGSLGETLLHVLIICDTKIHTRLARTLIKCFPKLALDVVEGEEYLGAGALHLAIAYTNNELVQDLVEAGANVNQRAIGSFFLPRDQQKQKPAKHTDYEGLAYLGEYPLAWAACCANESVYNLLLDSGANPDYQDNFGNMILHMVVVCDKLDMFGYALRHPKLPASNGIVNIDGLTPLTLACKLGRAEVFREMLELSAKEFWRYSNITCSAYTLNALDTLLPNGKTNWNSALFIILNGTKEEHLDMLDGGIIQRLLEEKWKTFARNQFLKRLLILVVHLIFLSLAVYLRPDDPDEPLLGWSDDPTVILRGILNKFPQKYLVNSSFGNFKDTTTRDLVMQSKCYLLYTTEAGREVRPAFRSNIFLYGCEIGTLIGDLSYVIFQQGDEIRNQGFWTFLKQQSNSPPKLIFLVSNLMILACIPARLSGDRKTEEAILLFAVPGSWFLLMFFAGAVRLTGPFVTMIYSMITGDMLTFGIIYTIVLFGFSQSFYFLYKGFPGVKSTLYHSYSSTWMALFQITLGNYDYQELSLTTYPGVAKTVFALFMVFVPILLLNMLIAMMGNTYAHVIEQSEKEWMKQWAKIVITLERAIPQSDAHHYLQEYSISLGPSDDPSTEQRGVMVIKSKNKTRAKQRKGAVLNWKRVCKVTVNALKKKGMTGEEMRCLMWGRESINTPIKLKGPRKDPFADPKGPNITGGFGDALTTALDVMAFTHDLDINGAAQGLNLANNPKPPIANNQQALPNNVSLNNHINNALTAQSVTGTAGLAMLGTLSQLTESQGFTQTTVQNINISQQQLNINISQQQITTTPITTRTTTVCSTTTPNLPAKPTSPAPNLFAKPSININTEDPLRDLVLSSLDRSCDPEKIKFLAYSSANLQNSEELPVQPQTKSVKTLAGIFAGTEAFVKKVEESVKKKYTTLDPSDSEGFGETPLLGKTSRTKRAKSAQLRNLSGRSKASDKRKLVPESDSSSTDTTVCDTTVPQEENLDYAEERMKSVKETMKGDGANLIRPRNIDVAVEDDQISTSISETIRVQGAGEGVETQAANVNVSEKKGKKKKRPRTSRNNRVGPTSNPRPCKSANNASGSETSDSPDPLEPWSTKGIENMNMILAWENENDSI